MARQRRLGGSRKCGSRAAHGLVDPRCLIAARPRRFTTGPVCDGCQKRWRNPERYLRSGKLGPLATRDVQARVRSAHPTGSRSFARPSRCSACSASTRPQSFHARSSRSLSQFPNIGPALAGRWEGSRFMLGPWRWLILVYVYIEAQDRVVVVTIQDARSSTAATASRP